MRTSERHQGTSSRRGSRLGVAALLISVTGVLLGSVIMHPASSQAQTGYGWSQPTMLYGGLVRSHMTALVSDPFGAAHVVWTLADEEIYYYSRWDGTAWTTPLDIVAVTDDVGLAPPALLAAADGSLHLFWARDSIMHTWAWAADGASSARAWSLPQASVVPDLPARDALDAKQDDLGAFHLVYTAGNDVYYVRSDDAGLTWEVPAAVSRAGTTRRTGSPRLDIGPDGRIHVVWDEWPADGDPAESSEVHYAYSADEAVSWSEPRQLGELANRGGNVLAAGDGTVYLAWQAGIMSSNPGRFVQRSTDGGITWEAPLTLGDSRGQSGYPSMALDGQGTLHLVTGDGEYAFWDDGSMSAPLDLRPLPEQTENALLTTLYGNQVLVFIGPFSSPGRYYTLRQLPLAPLPTATPAARVPAQVTASPDIAAEERASAESPTAPATLQVSGAVSPGSATSSTVPVLVLSVGLSLALVAGVLIAQLRLRRR